MDNNPSLFRLSSLPCLTLFATLILLPFLANARGGPPTGKGPGGGDDTVEVADGCSYPAFSDVPKLRLERKERRSRYDNFALRYQWIDELTNAESADFDESGSLDADVWISETMLDPLNRSGNKNINEYGTPTADSTPNGKRYSAWYDKSAAHSVPLNSGFALRGKRETGTNDPTRIGDTVFNNERLESAWLKTWERKKDTSGSWVLEGEKNTIGTHKFKAPLYLETMVNFSNMRTPGFRVSMWLMPATFDDVSAFESDETIDPTNEYCDGLQTGLLTNGCYSSNLVDGFKSEAYDRNWKNGYEMDIFEYEPVQVLRDKTGGEPGVVTEVCGNAIEFSALNDYESERGRDTEYAVKNHFEGFEEGYCHPMGDYGELNCDKTYSNPVGPTDYLINDDVWHKIGFLWTEKEILWIFNDEIVLEIDDPAHIPHKSVSQYLQVTREMTNGMTSSEILSEDNFNSYSTYIPAEPGLYGWDGRSNVGDHFDLINGDEDLINGDEAKIKYIKIWDLSKPGRLPGNY